MTNEQLWRALGCERKEGPNGFYWKRGKETCLAIDMPDYKNERGDEAAADAAAVALLEELRQRGHAVVVYGDDQGWSMENTPYPTFREAVVAGAEALLGVQS